MKSELFGDDCINLSDVKSPIGTGALRKVETIKRPRLHIIVEGRVSGKDARTRASVAKRFDEVSMCIAHHAQPPYDLDFVSHFPFLESFHLLDETFDRPELLASIPATITGLTIGSTHPKSMALDFLTRFTSLVDLHIDGHQKGIEAVASLKKLEKLRFSRARVPDLRVLGRLPKLRELYFSAGSLKDPSALTEWKKSLRWLEIRQTKGVGDVDFLTELTSLEKLVLADLPNVRALPSLRGHRRLKKIALLKMKSIGKLERIAEAPGLQDLQLRGSWPLASLKCFSGHPKLKRFGVDLGGDYHRNEEAKALLGNLPEYIFERDR